MPVRRHAAPRFGRLALLSACLCVAACSLDRVPHATGSGHTPALDGGGVAIDMGQAGQSHSGAGGSNAGNTTGNGIANAHDAGTVQGNLLDGSVPADAAADAAPQGYVPGSVGAPCTADAQCQAGLKMRTCFTESYFAPLLTLPGGYCGKLCDLSLSAPCEPGAACITFPTFPPVPVCMRACTVDNDCRVQDGYSCNKPFTSNTSVCSLRN
jgi:hypothetical protein